MTEKIIEIIADYLDIGVSELTPEKTFEELNVDSLDFIEILFEIEEKLNVKIPGSLQDLKQEIHCVGDVIRISNEVLEGKRS